MKKFFVFFMLSCMLYGNSAMAVSGNQAVKVDAVRNILTNKAPASMNKQKFLDALESGDVVTVQELLVACIKSVPENVACTECKVFITDIINYHNDLLNSVNIDDLPNPVVNPDGNNITNPDDDGKNITNPDGDGKNTTNPDGDGKNITNPDGDAGENKVVSPDSNIMPKTFKSVCEADGGKYSTGQATYNQVSYDGEWCGGNKTACVKLFDGSGIAVRGVADNAGKIYCFIGSEKDNFQMPSKKALPDAKSNPTYCMFGGNRWQNGIKTTKVTCNPADPFADSARGDCTCTCNNGKWNCAKTVVSSADACMLGDKNYASGAEVEIDCKDAPANQSSLKNGLKCKCNCYKKAWGCHLSQCQPDYELVKFSTGYECKKKVCAGVDKSKFEKVEEVNGKCKLTCPYGQVLNSNKTGCQPRYDKLFGSNSGFL